MTTSGSPAEPAEFRAAVEAMTSAQVRADIELGPIRPPQRLAPYSYAVGAEVVHEDTGVVAEQSEGDAFGRLILLFDPEGDEAWNGTMRLVAYIQADLDAAVASDPLLPEVAWSWLVDALEVAPRTAQRARRDGDRDDVGALRRHRRSPHAHQLELRASWTATSVELATHVEAFCEVLAYAAGLPPAGVSQLRTLGGE